MATWQADELIARGSTIPQFESNLLIASIAHMSHIYQTNGLGDEANSSSETGGAHTTGGQDTSSNTSQTSNVAVIVSPELTTRQSHSAVNSGTQAWIPASARAQSSMPRSGSIEREATNHTRSEAGQGGDRALSSRHSTAGRRGNGGGSRQTDGGPPIEILQLRPGRLIVADFDDSLTFCLPSARTGRSSTSAPKVDADQTHTTSQLAGSPYSEGVNSRHAADLPMNVGEPATDSQGRATRSLLRERLRRQALVGAMSSLNAETISLDESWDGDDDSSTVAPQQSDAHIHSTRRHDIVLSDASSAEQSDADRSGDSGNADDAENADRQLAREDHKRRRQRAA